MPSNYRKCFWAMGLLAVILPVVGAAASSPRVEELERGSRECDSRGGDRMLCANFREVERMCTQQVYWRMPDCIALREISQPGKQAEGESSAIDFDTLFATCARENDAACWRQTCELAVLAPTLSDSQLQHCVRNLKFRQGPNWFEAGRPRQDDDTSAWIVCRGLMNTFDKVGRTIRRHAQTQVNASPAGGFQFEKSSTSFQTFAEAARAGCEQATSEMSANAPH